MTKKINTNILTSENMMKMLLNYGIKNPAEILTKSIQAKTSIEIPELNVTLHWIYNGEKDWNFFEKNSTELDDYLFQLCEH